MYLAVGKWNFMQGIFYKAHSTACVQSIAFGYLLKKSSIQKSFWFGFCNSSS